jgi:hypothetical protein
MALYDGVEDAIAQAGDASANGCMLDLEGSDEVVALAQRVIEHSRIGHGAG